MKKTTTLLTVPVCALVFLFSPICSTAQTTVWLEEFNGGASTAGMWVDSLNMTDCRWEFAPDSVGPEDFSLDQATGALPMGQGFDTSFVFIDSDACAGTSVTVDTYLYSAQFDASVPGTYVLNFAHQFRARLQSFAQVDASPDGTSWTQIVQYTTADTGYPNPTTLESLDITAAIAGSATSAVRFQFNSGWDWWWALDSISVTYQMPSGLAELNSIPLNVYPSPTSDQLFIQYAQGTQAQAQVLDMLGNIVLVPGAARSIDVGELAKGPYLVLLRDQNGNILARQRFIRN